MFAPKSELFGRQLLATNHKGVGGASRLFCRNDLVEQQQMRRGNFDQTKFGRFGQCLA